MPATITSSQPKALYDSAGKNLAPKLALVELQSNKPNYNTQSFSEAIKSKYDEYMDRDDQVWRELYLSGQTVANCREGKLQLMRNPVTRNYAFVKKESKYNDNKMVGGLFQFYCTKLLAEFLSSRPERDPICPSDDDQVEEFISAVKIVQDYYDSKFFDVPYETQECLSLQDYGTSVTRFRYDPEKKDIVCELLDFPACRWDIRFTAEESPYFIYESKCSNAVLEHLLDADIAEDSDDDYKNSGLRIIEQIAKSGGNIEGLGKQRPYGIASPVQGENIVTQMWLQPEAYCDIDLTANEATVAGTMLNKGLTLLEMFPKGMCVVGINNMQTIIGLYSENHKEHIVSGFYHRQAFKGVGKGITDAVDVKKDIDAFHSQKMAFISAHSTPATYYNQDLISETKAKLIGKPRSVIPVDFKNAPDGVTSINQAIQTILPQNPGNSIWELGGELRNDLQMAMGVTDFSNGMPGVDNKTATGARIGDSNAEMLLVPSHLEKADQRKRSDVIIYNLFKKYIDIPRWFRFKNLNGITKGKYLSGQDFDGIDIDFEIVSNSEIPQSPFQQRDAQNQMYMVTGGAMGFAQLKQADPEYAGELATAYGVKLSIPKKTDIARVCRKRIEQAKRMLEEELKMQEVFAAMGIPISPEENADLPQRIVSNLSPRISPFEKYAQQKAEWLAELLDNDELQYAPMELRLVIEEMINFQLQAQTYGNMVIAQDQNAATAMTNAPMILGEQMLSTQNRQLEMEWEAQKMQVQQQQNEQNMVQQAELNNANAEQSEKQAQAQHQRALAVQDSQHANNLQLEAVKQLANMEKKETK